MKVAISARGNTLESGIDSRFARCAYFIIYDTDTDSWEAYENRLAAERGGVGTRNSQFLLSKGCKAVITAGNVGPNAMSVLKSSGVRCYGTNVGSVKEAITLFKEGKLQEI